MSECDGSGYIEYTDPDGFMLQRSCPGCDACRSQLPQPPAGQPEIAMIEIGPEVLTELLRAAATVRGVVADPPMTPDVAWALVISYLPALVEMSRQWMMAQENETAQISVSAHKVYDSGQ